jgi:Bacterial Ig-like domain (group 2)
MRNRNRLWWGAVSVLGLVVPLTSCTGTGGSGSGFTGSGSIVSIAVIPNAQTVQAPSQTTQFRAIGTTSSGATEDLTAQSTWASSSSQIATIAPSTGVATAVGSGSVTITAVYPLGGGTPLTGSATFNVSSGATSRYNALSITPGSQALTASGQTAQFIATASSGSSGLQTNVTNSSQIAWSSTSPSIASVNAGGLVTGVSVGATTITAQLTNPDNSVLIATATVTVTLTAPAEPILSLSIIPSSITVQNLQDTGQFIAIGTFSTPPYVRDLTNSVNWISTEPNVFPVSNDANTNNQQGTENGGIVSAYSNGSAVIIAEATTSDGTVQTATAMFNCPLVTPNPTSNPPTPGSCYPGSETPSLLSTLTVYNEGLNTTNWDVTAPSATGTANVLHCGPGWSLHGGAGGSVCSATYPIDTEVILTAPAGAGSFGGWSSNCVPSDVNGNALGAPPYWTANGPNYCVLWVTTDDTVGAIFN